MYLRMMKNILLLLTALTLITNQTMAEKDTVTIKIVQTSDVHGCLLPYDFIDKRPAYSSMAKVSSYVKALRQSYDGNVVLLDNGDILQGQPTCYYYNYVKVDCPNVASEVLNYLGYDACTIGNHDIETGHGVYDKWIGELSCPVLMANVIDANTGRPYSAPFAIVNRAGIKIAVIGLLTPAIPNWLDEELWGGMRFEGMLESARKWVEYIKGHEQPDVMVGLFHSGWAGGITDGSCLENEVERIAREVPGFDVIFFGHDHVRRDTVVSNSAEKPVVCLNPSCNAGYICEATVRVEMADGKVTAKQVQGEVKSLAGVGDDPDFVRRFDNNTMEVQDYVNKKIGRMGTTISTDDCLFGSAAFSDFIHNMQLDITGADISFNAPLSLGTEIAEGDVTVGDMFKLYRYENQICVMRLTGREVKDYLEMSYGLWTAQMEDAGDHIMLIDQARINDTQSHGFINPVYNFDSAAGIVYEVDVTKPAGEKVSIKHMADGRPFDSGAWYNVALNSYRANGGGELLTKGAGIPKDSLEGRVIFKSEKEQRYYLMKEIERMGIVRPKPNNNWRFVPAAWADEAIKRDRKLLFGTD